MKMDNFKNEKVSLIYFKYYINIKRWFVSLRMTPFDMMYF